MFIVLGKLYTKCELKDKAVIDLSMWLPWQPITIKMKNVLDAC